MTQCWQSSGPSLTCPSPLCPFLFQNKVVTVDGVRVKLQVRGSRGWDEGGRREELTLALHPKPQEA